MEEIELNKIIYCPVLLKLHKNGTKISVFQMHLMLLYENCNRATIACKIHWEKLHSDLSKTANLILSFQVKVT